MEETSANCEDAGNDEKSPPKKAKFDEQQPSTSSGSKSTTASNGAPSKGDPAVNGDGVTHNKSEGDVSSCEEAPVSSTDNPLNTVEIAETSSNTNQRWQMNGEEENEGNPETAGTSANETVEAAENPPAASSNASRPQRRRDSQQLERLRRNVHRLAYETLFGRNASENHNHEHDHDYDESSDEDIDLDDEEVNGRVRDELTNDLADLLALPRHFGRPDSSDNSSHGDQDVNGAAAAADANIEQAVAMMEYASDDSSSDSFSESSTDSDTSSNDESSPGSTESETAVEDDAIESAVVDIKNLECLKTDTLKGNWDVMREMMQRQHGLPLRTKTATVSRVHYNPSQFEKRAYGSLHMMKRLGLLHRLEQHSGCVNSLSFNSSGKLLASGSDDLHVNLWHWESKKLLKSIESGHRSNVFQTKFMEYKGYEGELEIISTGRDGHVRHTRVDPSGRSTTELLFRGHTPIHKIAIPARNEFSFLTAGEDGKVRMYDLRQGKQEVLNKLRRPLFSIATHPFDSEFCVAGSDSSVRVYDMRNTQKALKLLHSQQRADRKASQSVTCAVYNDTGTEILASYSDDDIYLYDNTVKKATVKPIGRFQGHCNTQTIKGVNFFGPRSEYVVSGSDCGYIFIWDKRTRAIVNWMNGDRRGAVNCLEPHPEFPILATSGVDNDIKIWVPKGPNDDQTVPLFAAQDLRRNVRRNILDRCHSYFPRPLMFTRSAYLHNSTAESFRNRFSNRLNNRLSNRLAAEFRANASNRPNNDGSDSDMLSDLDDDLQDDSPAHQMLRCNPS